MNVRRQDCRLAWLSLASLVLVLGLTLGTATGETPEPPMGLAAVKPATPMPPFSLPGLQGSGFDASALKDKVVVVRFWATW
jgi:cytochrome oxidase Cu insertion factor (SCO1/SenC/PrrC family)